MTATETMLRPMSMANSTPPGCAKAEGADRRRSAGAPHRGDVSRLSASLPLAACVQVAGVYAAEPSRLLPPHAAAPPWLARRGRPVVWAAAAWPGAGRGGRGPAAPGSGTRPSARGPDVVDEIAEYHAVFSRQPDSSGRRCRPRARRNSPSWLGRRACNAVSTIPDLAAEGLRFAGGRMLVVNGAPVAQFMYTRAQGLPVAVCIGQSEGAAQPVAVERRGAAARGGMAPRMASPMSWSARCRATWRALWPAGCRRRCGAERRDGRSGASAANDPEATPRFPGRSGGISNPRPPVPPDCTKAFPSL